MSSDLRARLVKCALEWQNAYGVAPAITSALAEYDAAILVGCAVDDYSVGMKGRTAVAAGYDFIHENLQYQVKANRPSGKPRSFVTKISKPKNYKWHRLIWVLYDENYVVQEAWQWEVNEFREAFDGIKYLRPVHLRGIGGKNLYTVRAQ